jgi:hypothetical protein
MPDIGLGGCGAGAIIMISLLCPGTLTERARTAARLRAGCLDLRRGARRRCGGAMSMAKVLFLRRIKRDIPGQAGLMIGSYKSCP